MSKIEDMKESYRQEKAQKKQSNGLNQEGLNEKAKELGETFKKLTGDSLRMANAMGSLTEETRETLESIRGESGNAGKELKEILDTFEKQWVEVRKSAEWIITESKAGISAIRKESDKQLRKWTFKSWVVVILVSILIGILSTSAIYLLHWKPQMESMFTSQKILSDNQVILNKQMKDIHEVIFKPNSKKK